MAPWLLEVSSVCFVIQESYIKINFDESFHDDTCSRAATFGKAQRPEPCLDFGFQYAFIRNNRSKRFGVEYWALPGGLGRST